MDQSSRVPLITQYLQTLGGCAPEIVKVAGSCLVLRCPICQGEYSKKICVLWRAREQQTSTGTTCSKSCMTKRRLLVNPDSFKAAGEKMRGRPKLGPRAAGIPRGPLSEEHKAAVSRTLRWKGHRPPVRKGNGTGMTPSESLVWPVLQMLGFEWNVAVSLGQRQPGYPTNYKLDFGHRQLKVGLELDGQSHRAEIRQKQDRKKEAKLAEFGWSVFRLQNAALEHLSSTFTLKDAMTILPAEFWSTIART